MHEYKCKMIRDLEISNVCIAKKKMSKTDQAPGP